MPPSASLKKKGQELNYDTPSVVKWCITTSKMLKAEKLCVPQNQWNFLSLELLIKEKERWNEFLEVKMCRRIGGEMVVREVNDRDTVNEDSAR